MYNGDVMVDEKLVIEKFELFKKNIMAKQHLRYKPEHLCMIFDRFIEYINSIKTEDE